jgi:hypothetical protein
LKEAEEEHEQDSKKLQEKNDKIKELEKDLDKKKDVLFTANSDSAKARDEL